MNGQVVTVMVSLIKRSVCEVEIEESVKASINEEMLPKLYALSKAHDMAHIVGQGLCELGLLGEDEIAQKFQKQQMLAVYRYQQLVYEQEQICAALQDAKIRFIPLKGAVLRGYYPEPWMRTSCDIDILVREDVLDEAAHCLEEKLGYQYQGKGPHDVSLFSPKGIHLELHYDTVEDGVANCANQLLSHIWEYASSTDPDSYRMNLTDEMFYFYHFAHMAKHFESGGCGVRPLLDLWILDHLIEHDQASREALLEEGHLLKFATECRKLSEVWFGDAESEPMTDRLQSFILNGGVYGNIDNRVAIQQTKHGGKFRYALSRIFLPYDVIKFSYPILQKHRWLLPVMQVRRWFRLIFRGSLKSSIHELNLNRSMEQDQMTGTAELLDMLGLH